MTYSHDSESEPSVEWESGKNDKQVEHNIKNLLQGRELAGETLTIVALRLRYCATGDSATRLHVTLSLSLSVFPHTVLW